MTINVCLLSAVIYHALYMRGSPQTFEGGMDKTNLVTLVAGAGPTAL